VSAFERSIRNWALSPRGVSGFESSLRAIAHRIDNRSRMHVQRPAPHGWELMASFWKRRARNKGITVRRTEAGVGDGAALDRLLHALPEADELRPRLRATFFARAWDAATQRDHWILSDGSWVRCFTIDGLTLRQAASVRVRWDAMRDRTELTEERLADVVAGETGTSVTLVS
jgi:hypothetical protein